MTTGTTGKTVVRPPSKPPKRMDDDDDDGDDSASDDGYDSAGSLADFMVDDDDDECQQEVGAAAKGSTSDMDGIDPKNILSTKRTRTKTNFYDRTVFESAEYRKMILEDIPDDEVGAALGEEDSEEEEKPKSPKPEEITKEKLAEVQK